MLDPQARALIDLMIQRQVPATHTLSPTEARRLYVERRGYTQPEPPAVAAVQNLATDTGVPLRLYRPLGVGMGMGVSTGTGVEAPPVLVYFHGGGWTIGDLDTHDVLCRQLCAASGAAVVAVHYRLAPENRFPAAVDDCVAATHWVQKQGTALGIDSTRLAVGGDSAGGNLAAVVSLVLRDAARGVARAPAEEPAHESAHETGPPAPVFQLLIYPATDQRLGAPSHQTNAQGYLLTADSIAYFRGHYLPDAATWLDWRASPLLASDHRGLPPALVLTAGFDPLRDEGHAYADVLSAAGTRVQVVCFGRQVHGFITMGRVLDEARSAVGLCAAVLREALMPR